MNCPTQFLPKPARNKKGIKCTGKSMSEALIFASTNPHYDKSLSSELPVQCMEIPSSEHGENMRRTYCAQKLFWMSKQNKNNNLCTQHVLQVFILSLQFSWKMNNLPSYCGLVDAKIRASDKDLTVRAEKQSFQL